jgi:hypothetical protein
MPGAPTLSSAAAASSAESIRAYGATLMPRPAISSFSRARSCVIVSEAGNGSTGTPCSARRVTAAAGTFSNS